MVSNLAFTLPGGWEWLVILAVALLIFGSRLPEVGKSIGRGIVEFKKGLKGVKDELDEVDRDVRDAAEQDDDPRQIEGDASASSSTTNKQEAKTSS